MPYLDKGKWNPKVKTEIRNAFPEAKKIVNKYSVPKPHLTSYALTSKAPLTKEISTRAGEIQILSRTSVNKTNTCNSSSMTEKCSTSPIPFCGRFRCSHQKPADSTTTKSVAANLSPEGKLKTQKQPGAQGGKDAVAFYNRFGALEDMDYVPSPSSTRKKTQSEDIS